MVDILSIKAIEILDSRGNPTLKTFVTLDDGTVGSASVPSGASTGVHEALELRDNDDHYLGKGVGRAVQNVNGILAHELKGMSINDLKKIDKHMLSVDGTENKSELGANAILSVSLACARAYAAYHKEPLWKALNDYYFTHTKIGFPRLFVNVINGGAHANWVIDIQECMISPVESSPSTSVEIAANVFHTLKKILLTEGYAISVGDEGGFAPQLETNEQAFQHLDQAIKDAGYSRDSVDIATDIAASEFYKNGSYRLQKAGDHKKTMNSSEFSDYLLGLHDHFNILSYEDPFAEDDWEGFVNFTQRVGKDHMVVGDDLFVTNTERIKQGIEKKAANAVLVKVNQIGSLYETVEAIEMAQKAGWKVVISHRSGETSDSFISDLAVACGADFIKAGSMSRSERLVKYNRLLEIEKVEY